MKRVAIVTSEIRTGYDLLENIDTVLILKPETTVQEIILYYQNRGLTNCTIRLVPTGEAGEESQ